MVMKKILGICFLFIRILVVPVCSVPTNQDKLVSVAVIMRHGERTFKQNTYPNDPYRNLSFGHRGFAQLTNIFRHGARTLKQQSYPKDPYQNMSFGTEGYAQLTKTGKAQAFELGQWLRKRYDGFLSRRYSVRDIYVISSDADRSIMTAQCTLAGLYPPELEDYWNPQLMWQPIPIHTIPKEDDIITYHSRDCPIFNHFLEELITTNEHFNKVDESNAKFYANLTENLGVNVTTFQDIQDHYDTLQIQELHNLSLPNWSQGIYPEKLLPFVRLHFQANTYTTKLKRLSVGPLLNKILTHFNNIKIQAEEPKLLVFSSHRSKLTNFLYSLKFENLEYDFPNYGDILIIELKQNGTDRESHYINFLYKPSGTIMEPEQLILNNCEFDCEYNALIRLLEPISVDIKQWTKECTNAYGSKNSGNRQESHNIITWLYVFCSMKLVTLFKY